MRLSALIGLLLVVLPVSGQDSLTKQELQKLQGEWVQISVNADGRKLESGNAGPAVTITENKWIEKSAGGESVSTFTIDPSTNPKQIDKSITVNGGKPVVFPSIYTLEDDTLTVASPFPFGGDVSQIQERPGQFATKPGDPFVVVVYKRAMAGPKTQEARSAAWQTDWKTAFKMAKGDHRLVFVHYCAFSCTACRIMDEVFFARPDVQARLADFVLLREDFNNFNAPHGVASFPTYVVYDSGERERFRISGGNPSAEVPGRDVFQRLCGSTINDDTISRWLDGVRALAQTFVSVADLIDQGHELEADFLLGNTYERKGSVRQAREMYDRARGLAEKNGDKARAQMAEAESAFTYARENDPSRAIKLLRKLTSNPVDRKTEAFLWLELGRAYTLAKDANAARDAYQRTLTVAVPDSAAYREASAAIAKLR